MGIFRSPSFRQGEGGTGPDSTTTLHLRLVHARPSALAPRQTVRRVRAVHSELKTLRSHPTSIDDSTTRDPPLKQNTCIRSAHTHVPGRPTCPLLVSSPATIQALKLSAFCVALRVYGLDRQQGLPDSTTVDIRRPMPLRRHYIHKSHPCVLQRNPRNRTYALPYLKKKLLPRFVFHCGFEAVKPPCGNALAPRASQLGRRS